MAIYINEYDLQIPFYRIQESQYMFGSRKIFAKIMNDKLVIRVGGGYMIITEFLQTYGSLEAEKVKGSPNKPGSARASPSA